MDEDIDDFDDLAQLIAEEIEKFPNFAIMIDNAGEHHKLAYQYYLLHGEDENLENFTAWAGTVFAALGEAGYRVKIDIEKIEA